MVDKRGNNKPVQALVIANATVDETYRVNRFPAIGESVTGQLSSHGVGGKGANVATVLSRCGIATKLLAVVGHDARGEFVKAALNQESMTLDLVQTTQCDTDVSLIYVDSNGENTIVSTVAATHSLDSSLACRALEQVQENGLLILQGNLTEELTRLLVSTAAQQGLRVVLNPSPYWSWMKPLVPVVNTVFMNEVEALAITGDSGEAAIATILDLGVENAVLTRGAKSALLGTRCSYPNEHSQHTIDHVPCVSTSVVDTSGAGDTYLAVAIASAAHRHTRLDVTALAHAARAAAHTIGSHGTHNAFPAASILSSILTD